jgi:hypothetical protein
MQVPEAKCGRYYFECYPHPALLGLFDLDHILKYKAAKGRTDEWQRLIVLLRSLIDAELPIRNIKAYVPDDLLQNKSNEDRLDALISAYVAAYWWRFGAGRSTMIGDPSTGYIVTPHSARTFAAFGRVFHGRMNQRELAPAAAAPTVQSVSPLLNGSRTTPGLPACDWVYFATPARWGGTMTSRFVAEHKAIVRNIFNSVGQKIANVQHLRPGDTILLAYGGNGRGYEAIYRCTVCAAASPVQHGRNRFEVFCCLDDSLDTALIAGGYTRDPVIGCFTGITISDVKDLRLQHYAIRRPERSHTLMPWPTVFPKR